MVVVLDEFMYLIHVNDALPSVFQKLWDTQLQSTQMMLVLCGSYVGMMEQEVLAYRSPLYGRRTGRWRLQSLSFWDARKMLSQFSLDDQVRAYALLGEVPVTETNPAKSRMGIYQIADSYFRFWFRFVYPNRSLLERAKPVM